MTEDIRRYRGDWLLRALTDDHHGHTPWQRLDGTPPGIPKPAPGRYDPTTQKWDTQAGRSGGINRPLIATLAIPPETRINYPGETITITPQTYARIYDRMTTLGIHEAFHDWATRGGNEPIATYWPSQARVVWTRHPPDHLKKPLRAAVRICSDLVAPNPRKLAETLDATSTP